VVSSGTAKLSAIEDMLKRCAPEYRIRDHGPHKYRVEWNGRTYWSLPKGAHGEKDPEIQMGHIKKMIQFLGISMDCAKKNLPPLN
jgi:hypothetical protein